MRILVIGSGGREHAIAWRLAGSGHTVYGAPGNPGIAGVGEIFATADYPALAESLGVDFTVVGPEAPLVDGVVDRFRARGLRIFGPNQEAARLEASKIHSKDFMQRAGIPTARYARAGTTQEAHEALADLGFPVVVKADGLAAGKGVVVAENRAQADAAIAQLGPRLVLEEFLEGEEVSFIVLSDGRHVLPLEATQDHKRVGDGDTGPNTGGMGAYCDGRILTDAATRRILDTIIEPAVAQSGFTGFLYAGLMMTPDGPKVLEFNVRLGDPETQPLMHRLNSDFGAILDAAIAGELNRVQLAWHPDPSVCVILAASGYPGTSRSGDLIHGIERCGTTVFQAGTKRTQDGLRTAGGRVLGVTSSGPDLDSAIADTYAAVRKIHFAGAHYRNDIGAKGLKRWANPATRHAGLSD
ncbi:MAG: phosphoribosylamine--glycine ligase [Bryobacteraceae bacterium]